MLSVLTLEEGKTSRVEERGGWAADGFSQAHNHSQSLSSPQECPPLFFRDLRFNEGFLSVEKALSQPVYFRLGFLSLVTMSERKGGNAACLVRKVWMRFL